MSTLAMILTLAYLIGLALGLGSATVKIVLLMKCHKNHNFFPHFFRVSKPITKLLVTGIILLILSGAGWLIYGYPISTLMVVKIILVGLVFISGSLIDYFIEPRLAKAVLSAVAEPSSSFAKIQQQHLALEILATLAMYAITVMGVLL